MKNRCVWKTLGVGVLLFLGIGLSSLYVHALEHHYTLDNGLEVLLIEDPNASLVSARTFVRAGSIHEGKLLGHGLSHYLEHLVAGGSTTKRSETEYKRILAELGGASNAYTTSDHTSYYINTTPKQVLRAITLLYEWMSYARFDKKEFNREKSVIIKEMERANANVNRQFYYLSQFNFYKTNPLQHPVIGYLDNFKQTTRSDIKTYYKTHYVPSNMVLIIGGNINVAKLKRYIRRTFGKMPKKVTPQKFVINEPKPLVQRRLMTRENTEVSRMSIRFPSVNFMHKSLYAVDLMEYILGEGKQSILHQKLVEQTSLAYRVTCASYTPMETTGYFEIAVEADEKNIPIIEAEIWTIINDIKKGKIKKYHIERAKKQKNTHDVFSLKTVEDKVHKKGLSILYSYTPNFFETYAANFKSVTKKKLKKVARRVFNKDHAVITIIHPNITPKPSEISDTLVTASEPDIKVTSLSNGIRVVWIKEPGSKKIITSVYIKGGTSDEIANKNGIGAMWGHLFGKGSKRYSKQKLEKSFEKNGASYAFSAGKELNAARLECLSEDSKKLLPLFYDAVLNPGIREDDFAHAKKQVITRINQRKESWFHEAMYLAYKQFYGDHPYGQPVEGEKETVNVLTKEDVLVHYKSQLSPDKLVITVMGDYRQDEIEKILRKYVVKNQLAATKLSTIQVPDPHNKQQKSNHALPKDVAALIIMSDGVPRKQTKDEINIAVLDAVLSGMRYPGGRLHNRLRGKGKGLVYVVHAFHKPYEKSGQFVIYALTSKDQLIEVEQIILEEINTLKKQKISQEEFEKAIAQVEYNYREKIMSLDGLGKTIATDLLFERGIYHYKQIFTELDKLNTSVVQKTANGVLNNLQIYRFNAPKK